MDKLSEELVFIQNLVNRIEGNLADEVNVIALAESFELSPWHFQRLFKSLVGDTLGSYIRGRKLTRAAQLLLDSNQSLIDIAFSVGFNSHEAFTRSFKSHFDLSPKAFRQTRPSVRLNEKPLLTTELYQHLANTVQREPNIVIKPQQTIVGFDTDIPSPFILNESYCHLLAEPWANLLGRQTEIDSRITQTYYGLTISHSGNFTEDNLEFIAGLPVTSVDHLPEGMMSYSFPEQQVAIFDVASVKNDTVGKTMDYIYGYWLPNSKYKRGQGNDYELFEGVSDFSDPNLSSKYVIPVELK